MMQSLLRLIYKEVIMTLAKGINTDYACMLIAMDEMFDGDYEGREFIHELFIELWNDIGFPHDHFYLLEESADVFALPKGKWTTKYTQGVQYFQLYARDGSNLRLRVTANSKLIYLYDIDGGTSHAVCVHASFLNNLMYKTTFSGIILPRRGLLKDYKEYTE